MTWAVCCCAVQVHDGTLYVNGVAREEPFIYQKPAYTLGKLVVPPGDVSGRLGVTCCCTSASLAVNCQQLL
jgi:hypothetical protein